nr:unnamed protein product [Digitaria exilis]
MCACQIAEHTRNYLFAAFVAGQPWTEEASVKGRRPHLPDSNEVNGGLAAATSSKVSSVCECDSLARLLERFGSRIISMDTKNKGGLGQIWLGASTWYHIVDACEGRLASTATTQKGIVGAEVERIDHQAALEHALIKIMARNSIKGSKCHGPRDMRRAPVDTSPSSSQLPSRSNDRQLLDWVRR